MDLQNNGLAFISSGAFRVFDFLNTLHLDNNMLTYAAIKPVLLARRLQVLSLTNMQLGSPPGDFFVPRWRSLNLLRRIDISNNKIHQLNFSTFAPLTRLSVLLASNCQMLDVTSAYMPGLQALHLVSNVLFNMPETCSNSRTSLFPKLGHLILRDNKITTLPARVCLPELDSLDLSVNPIKVFETDMFRNRFPTLTKLFLNDIQWNAKSRIDRFAFRHPNLTELSLMSCGIPFSYDNVDPDCFTGLPRLGLLQLSHSLAYGVGDAKLAGFFSSMTGLSKLYFGGSGINIITEHTFGHLSGLTILVLYQNKLVEISDGAFDSLKNLTVLNLSQNLLTTVSKRLFSSETQHRLRHLDLSGNPLSCACDLLWFKQWFVTMPNLFSHSHTTYTCKNSTSTVSLKDFSLNEQACLLSMQTSKIIISSGVIVLVLAALVATVYRYRWYIRLVLAFHTRGFVRRQEAEEEFMYDIFVSFDSDDLGWVRQHLIPNLEDRLGLRLCIHERDFVPGKNILENIEDSVESSRRILLVFSKHFAHSQWCQFELNLCLRHSFEHGDALLVALLGGVESRDLTNAMMAVLDTTTYIQWEDDVQFRGRFWERLDFALQSLLPQAPRPVLP
ncbi:toll-like receptor 13 [Littorina saxatilis]